MLLDDEIIQRISFHFASSLKISAKVITIQIRHTRAGTKYLSGSLPSGRKVHPPSGRKTSG
ncbi:hypothetical protein BACCOPRO_01241 [Phocaeicola coprophilus DSM 18228 = JCM 13818]|uniref:Uncharacterized protein n=1 Tax=Phocaeicola coprophilus DSM 18228 = JCM 13818 TaxID=547042 RepID=S0F6T4_9BACT|nr:hypothetical protein BACCOPRO_01241 [Phocaeicola coprophilus DSM 18228 = JCM 13818]